MRPASDASLFIAPRILNDPVRCRFSALSATEPPTISDSVTDDTTGVCLTTDAPVSRARRIASRSTPSTVVMAANGTPRRPTDLDS